MDISRIHSSTASAIQQARTDESDDVRGAKHADIAKGADTAAVDALDVQSAASEAPELTAARAALRQSDTLDDARRAEIMDKIQSGFYNSPDGIAKVSEAMAAALQSSKKAE